MCLREKAGSFKISFEFVKVADLDLQASLLWLFIFACYPGIFDYVEL